MAENPNPEDTAANNQTDATIEQDTQTGTTDDVATPADVPQIGGDADATGSDTVELNCPETGPRDAGCPCTTVSQCSSNYCIATPKGQVCAATCTDKCEDGFKCVTGEGVDATNICVPQYGSLCNPCNSNTDCQAVGNKDARCVDQGNNGAFCGSGCTADTECPSGYTCSEVKDVTGAASKQCVVKDGGACGCTDYAKQIQLSTKCYVATGDGKCEGKRTCLPAGVQNAPEGGGLSACIAAAAKDEVCDGSDNDCDGQTDEATCDDKNVCTVDKCDGAAGCKTTPNTDPCDADGSKCTEKDVCKDGTCTPGAALNCDDGNPCTKDTCDPKEGCKHENADGGTCDADNNPCTVGDTCKAGTCEAGAPKACPSEDSCLLGKCNVADGKCTYTVQDGNPCNDGNPCTTGEKCVKEICKGDLLNCDDGTPCTGDSCDPKSGCAHVSVAGVCDDSDACTTKDACKDGNCVGAPIDVTGTCDDQNPCTIDICDPKSGCAHKNAVGTKCDDGNPCTPDEACKDSKCQATQNTCGCNQDSDCAGKEDGNLCNGTLFCDKSALPYACKVKEETIIKCDDLGNECATNACDAVTGKCKITKKPDGLSCNADDSLCTAGDACKEGTCSPGAVQVCDDKNSCTSDSCDPKAGCKYTPNTAPCDADDNPCTENDACQAGSCVAGKVKACVNADQCIDGKCNVLDGKCKYSFKEGAPCNDNSPCTINDKCKTDQCLGEAANCNDDNPCTGDSCDPASGCVHKPITAACDDGNACTTQDACAAGSCAGTAVDTQKFCEDDNVCTTESCDAKTGCVHKPAAGTCTDGNDCTVGDACDAGKCVSGTNTCDCKQDSDCGAKEDGNLCNGTLFCDKAKLPYQCKINPTTIKVCDSSTNPCQSIGCNPTNGLCETDTKQDGTPCDADGTVCTSGDSCLSGKCTAGKIVVCDDKNACTDDSCDVKAGCKYVPNTAPCDGDSNACTENDVCKDGTCTLGKLKQCDDSEGCTQDTCDTKTGKCLYAPITKSCSDNNVCTSGDLCGEDPKTLAYTCVSGKATNCDDSNVCTVDSCDALKGCQSIVDPTIKVACYTGPSGTKNKGLCKEGKQACGSDGKLGTCQGEVLPANKELCNGQDDTCDGVTDEGCAPTGFTARMGNAVVSGSGTKFASRTFLGGSQSAGATGGTGKVTADLGFYQWIKKLIGY